MNYEKIITEKGFEYIQVVNGDEEITIIPIDDSNADYRAYLLWLEEQA